MNDVESIAEEYYATKYEEYNYPKHEEEYEEEEVEICQGNECINEEEEDGTQLCRHCQKQIQAMFEEFCDDFNEVELKYLIKYIKEREVL